MASSAGSTPRCTPGRHTAPGRAAPISRSPTAPSPAHRPPYHAHAGIRRPKAPRVLVFLPRRHGVRLAAVGVDDQHLRRVLAQRRREGSVKHDALHRLPRAVLDEHVPHPGVPVLIRRHHRQRPRLPLPAGVLRLFRCWALRCFRRGGEGISSAFRGVSACVTCVSAASSIGDCRSTVSTGSGSESAAHRSPSSHCTSRCASELSRTACAAARRSWLPTHTAASHSTNAPHTAAAPRRHFTSPTAFQTSLCPDKQKNTRHNFL